MENRAIITAIWQQLGLNFRNGPSIVNCIPAAPQTDYDTLIYPSYSYAQTHPDHVATLARLCALQPASPETCRVLEVGCGDASNIIPMAAGLPKASFRGFDLAASAIERGREFAGELGLTNLTLESLDICDVPDRLGEFDYIIAHGFYSWVPPAARDKLMAICRASLAPQGIALISYNTFPGGYVRQMIRDMMQFHVARAPDPQTKAAQGRALLGFLSKLNAGEDEYQLLMKKELKRLLDYNPAHLYHDDLAPVCDFFYLHEFVSHAARHDLQYVADLDSSFVHVSGLDEESAEALAGLDSDPILREQYLDFASCRRFRQTLLCHSGLHIDPKLDTRRVQGLLISSAAIPVRKEASSNSDEKEEFRGVQNASLTTSHPVVKAAMWTLTSAWPRRFSFEELRAQVAERLEVSMDSIPIDVLSEAILSAFLMSVLDFHVYAPRVTPQPGDSPQTSLLARLMAKKSGVVTNLLHQSITVEQDGRRLLVLLDGKRNRDQLAAELNTSRAAIDLGLEQLARLALLQA